MEIQIYQVDAFTSQPFTGNPAGVCLLQGRGDESWMQNVASEMNLSETAFLYKEKDGYNLRWFTPSVEVDLCGHATLASAHILWEQGILLEDEKAIFYTRSGELTAVRTKNGIEMDFPATPEKPAESILDIKGALGLTPKYIGRNQFDCIVEIDSEDSVRNMKPDFHLIKKLPVRGIIVTSHSISDEYDFVSRFFAPLVGVNEDPVTGSAHCCLGPYWRKKLGKDKFVAYQASKRGGVVHVRVKDDRVVLGGEAVTVMKAELYA